MSGKKKLLLVFLGLCLFLAGAGVSYRYLKKTIMPQDGLTPVETKAEEKDDKDRESSDKSEKDSRNADQGSGTENDSTSDSQETEEIKALDFTALDADGKEIQLSDFIGKPIVLNFWASWCPPCKEEMPYFNTLYTEVGQDVVFMMMNMTDGERETVEKASAFIADQGYTFPVYHDTRGEVSQVYGITSLPTTLFIDKEGNIAVGAQGAIDEETLRKGLGYITDMEEE